MSLVLPDSVRKNNFSLHGFQVSMLATHLCMCCLHSITIFFIWFQVSVVARHLSMCCLHSITIFFLEKIPHSCTILFYSEKKNSPDQKTICKQYKSCHVHSPVSSHRENQSTVATKNEAFTVQWALIGVSQIIHSLLWRYSQKICSLWEQIISLYTALQCNIMTFISQ